MIYFSLAENTDAFTTYTVALKFNSKNQIHFNVHFAILYNTLIISHTSMNNLIAIYTLL